MKFAAFLLLVAVGVASAAVVQHPVRGHAVVQNKDFGEMVQQMVQAVIAQAQTVIANIQTVAGQVINLSQTAVAQVQVAIGQLQQVAQIAQANALPIIQGLISDLQDLINQSGLVPVPQGALFAEKGMVDIIQNMINTVMTQVAAVIAQIQAQAQVVGGQIQTISAQAQAQLQAALQQLQQIAAIAQGQAQTTIQSMIASIQSILAGAGIGRVAHNKSIGAAIQQMVSIVVSQVQNLVAAVIAQAQVVGGQIQTISAQTQAQLQAALQQLQMIANLAQGQTQATIQGLIASIQAILAGNGRVAHTKNLGAAVQQIVSAVIAQVQQVVAAVTAQVGQIQAISVEAQAHLEGALQQLQQIANIAQGQAQTVIQGLISSIQDLLAGAGNGRVLTRGAWGDLVQAVIANVVATIQVAIQNIKDELAIVGGNIADLSEQAMAQLNAALEQLQDLASVATGGLQTTINNLVSELQEIVNGAGKVTVNRNIGAMVQQIIDQVISHANAILANIQAQATIVAGQITNLSQAAAAQVQAAIQELQQVAQMAHGQALATIQGLIGSLQALLAGVGQQQVSLFTPSGLRVSGNKGLSDMVQNMISVVVSQIAAVVAQIQAQANVVGGQIQAISAQAQAQLQAALQQLQQIANMAQGQMQTTIQGLIANIQAILGGAGNGRVANKNIGNMIQQAMAMIVAQVQQVIASIQQQIAVVGGNISNLSQQAQAAAAAALATLQQIASVAQGQLAATVQQLIAQLQQIMGGRTAVQKNQSIGAMIQQIVAQVVAQVQTIVAQIQQEVVDAIATGQVLSEQTQAAVQAALDQLQQVAAIATGQAQTTIQGLIASLQTILNGNARMGNIQDLIASLNLPELIENAIQNVINNAPTTDQISNLISQIAPLLDQIPGIGQLIDHLVQIMLGNGRSNIQDVIASLNLPADLLNTIQNVLNNNPTSDQLNNLISQIAPLMGQIPGIGQLIFHLAQLMIGQGRGVSEVVAVFPQIIAAVQDTLASGLAGIQEAAAQLVQDVINGGEVSQVNIQAAVAAFQQLAQELLEAIQPLIAAIHA